MKRHIGEAAKNFKKGASLFYLKNLKLIPDRLIIHTSQQVIDHLIGMLAKGLAVSVKMLSVDAWIC